MKENKIMAEYKCYATETIFHCYINGEWVDTFGIWNTDDDFDIAEKEIVDFTNCDEVRCITIGPSKVYWDPIEETPDDYKFKCREVTYKMPDGSEMICFEPVDEILDWENFGPDGYGEIEVVSYNKEGSHTVEIDDRIEDDEDLGW